MATILHVDMDAFFAAVELLDNPEYRAQPLIIGGRKDSPRGVVSTCSYEARKFGVHSAMPIKKAVALCPQGIFVPGRMQRYQEVSRQIHALLPEFSPTVEPLSIDEAFLDMTGCEHFYASLEDMGTRLKKRVSEAVGVTASVGIAPNKFLAKLASDMDKPDGLVVIRPQDVDVILRDLPVTKLWGVGEKLGRRLAAEGIRSIHQLRRFSEEALTQRYGSMGRQLFELSRGIDHRSVEPYSEAKSISQEQTFDEDYEDQEFLRAVIAQLAEKVGWRLRRQELAAKTVHIKVRFADFHTITRSHTLAQRFSDDDTIFGWAWHLFARLPQQPIRLLGVGVSGFGESRQLSLFDDEAQASALADIMDAVNTKYEKPALTKGRTVFRAKK